MVIFFVSVAICLILLLWSADRFVEGAAATARHYGFPSLLIGMLIIGFGTSAPEMLVSVLSARQGNPGIALGNAYGSNITNIALILGLTALIAPITVQSQILRKELPILCGTTLLAIWQLRDNRVSTVDAAVLLFLFVCFIGWSIFAAIHRKSDSFAGEVQQKMTAHSLPIHQALFWMVAGLVLLVVSSRILVWGAVNLAKEFGVSDLIIGLTIIAIGTSLPELASSIAAIRKGEHDIAFGNVIGSNIFNTLAVVGLAGMVSPMGVDRDVFARDLPVMTILTFSLFVVGYGFRGTGRINRFEGFVLLSSFVAYITFLVWTA